MIGKTSFRDVRKMAQLLVAVVTLVLALSMGRGVALAHAELTSSTPAEGSTVQAGLTEITLVFDDELNVDTSTAEVTGPGGAMSGVTASVDRAERSRMTVKTAPLAAGEYKVKWTAVADDDNNIAVGTLSFTVAASGAGTTTTSGAGSSSATGGTGSTTNAGGASEGSSTLPVTGLGASESISLLLMVTAAGVLTLGVLLRRSTEK